MTPSHQSRGTLSAAAFEFIERSEGWVGSLSPQARSLWAKTGDETGWLDLPQHLVDSAGVAAQLWDAWLAPSVKATIVRATGLAEEDARTLCLWLVATHDLGKSTLTFQRQIENSADGESFVNRVADAGLPLDMHPFEEGMTKFPHALGTRVILRGWLLDQGLKGSVANSLVAVGDAHHGIPSDPVLRRVAAEVIAEYPEAWSSVHAELLEGIADLTGIRGVLPSIRRALRAPVLQLITGLVIMADWIASNSEAFPMVVQASQVERVARGMDFVELTGPWTAEDLDPGDIDSYLRRSFHWPEDYSARPVQRAVAQAVDEAAAPAMVIIEAPTGEGKTEAALAAVQMIAARTGAHGVIFAAPTMSTANGLFNRVVEWGRSNTPEHGISSMFLAHSKSALSESFRDLKFSRIGDEGSARAGSGPAGQRPGAVVANQWLSGRKRGILANFVVATVDQILLLALQSRHSMLRHLGLAGKVVVVDEVHAYDAYMSAYLERALEWLARYGVSVVLMSATLPVEQKQNLARAYSQELLADPAVPDSTAYPLITVVGADGVQQREVASRPSDLDATVALIEDDPEQLQRELAAVTPDGGCVLVVCNTIRRAQEVYLRLAEQFPDQVELHHAAFMAGDRARKEDELREQLGPDAHRSSGRPWRRFIVATQVAEQSLDIDADLLVTDIAPMDLVVQRIGRLHRHPRPASDRPGNLRRPQVWIRGVLQSSPVPEFESGTAHVYDPKILMATLAVLQDRVFDSGFRRPDDIAELVHATYAEDVDVPEEWEEAWHAARRESEEHQAIVRQRATSFRFPAPKDADKLDRLFERYFGDVDVAKGDEAGAAQVRDADPTIEVIPIVSTGYGYLPLGEKDPVELVDDAAPDSSQAFRMANSTVRLPARFSRYDSVFERTITQLELDTPAGWSQHHLLRGQVALRLDENREIELAGRILRYSDEMGLEEVAE